MPKKTKALKEPFAEFFEKPTREGLRSLLKDHLGEFSNLDFKMAWPSWPDVARHSLAMANTGGGCMIVGVEQKEDNAFEPTGLDKMADKKQVLDGVRKYLPQDVLDNILLLDFKYQEAEYAAIRGKKFQVILVEDVPSHLPFAATRDGDGIRANAVYVRRGAASEEASHEELQDVINRRLSTGHSSRPEMDLRTHLEQLKMLYQEVGRYTPSGFLALKTIALALGPANPNYPEEDCEQFIARMIRYKKEVIERVITKA